jgi:hypothetical protein
VHLPQKTLTRAGQVIPGHDQEDADENAKNSAKPQVSTNEADQHDHVKGR